VPGTFTAQAFITTDLDDNQITAFHPGAMMMSHLNKVETAGRAPRHRVAGRRDGMLEHARQFAEAGIPFIFDPGQGLPMFNGDELLACLQLADYCTVNDYEARLLCDRTGRSIESLAGEVKALIVTRGGEGSEIHTGGRRIDIPTASPTAVQDPTGCGDAYRAGLLYGIERNGLGPDRPPRLPDGRHQDRQPRRAEPPPAVTTSPKPIAQPSAPHFGERKTMRILNLTSPCLPPSPSPAAPAASAAATMSAPRPAG
jgi:sugar/nucleoside kinase (ribokinase family)